MPQRNEHPPQHVCTHGEPCRHGDLGRHEEGRDAICLEHVSFSYAWAGGSASAWRGEAPLALRDVTLHVEQGCNLGIIGPNGAGKTTLLKIILGLLEGYTGTVSVMGMTPRQACRRGDVIGYVPQRLEVEWRFPVTVRQVVRMGLVGKTGLFRAYSRTDRRYAEELMDRVGVAPLADRPIGSLSGGQQQRAFIARALVAKPPILILDEPTVGIDQPGQRQFAELVHQLHESLNLTLIVVSHDLKAIAAGCNRVACLNQSIHYHAAPQGLTREVLNEVFAHEVAPADLGATA